MCDVFDPFVCAGNVIIVLFDKTQKCFKKKMVVY